MCASPQVETTLGEIDAASLTGEKKPDCVRQLETQDVQLL